jgi:hypothetical protein
MTRFTLALAALAVLAAIPARAQQLPPSERIGSFRYSHRTDPITDADVSYVSVDQQTTALSPAVLQWKCMNNGGYGIWVGSPGLGIADSLDVTWRFDQNAPRTQKWRVVGGRLVVLTDGWEDFTASARASSRLAMRVSLGDGRELTWVFSLNGSTAALGRLPCLDADEGSATSTP